MDSVEKPGKTHRILMAEDNEEHYFLTQEVIQEAGLPIELLWVKDGQQLMDHLRQNLSPEIILLDLNMPKKTGKEALKEIKADPRLRRIPVVILSTSGSDEDVQDSYDLGANAYLQKPAGFDPYARALKSLYEYWFVVSKIPPGAAPYAA